MYFYWIWDIPKCVTTIRNMSYGGKFCRPIKMLGAGEVVVRGESEPAIQFEKISLEYSF